ncbi:MAG: integrase core domain-containing protein [Pseudomonadota bacterium]
MQIHRVGYGIRGFYRIAELGHLWAMTPKDAQERFKILQFWDKHGLEATMEAFGVSRRTLYRWKKAVKDASGNPAALAACSSRPKTCRAPTTPTCVKRQIRLLRQAHPNLGKAKLHVLIAPWCEAQRLPVPSVSTIGRIIAREPDKMRFAPQKLDARGRPKKPRQEKLKKARKPKDLHAAPMTLWAVDTIERVLDGVRRYILSLFDPVSRMGFAVALPSKTTQATAQALEALILVLSEPQQPMSAPRVLYVLSDNGPEFKKHFHALLEKHGLTHFWTYPRSPKMNAHVERFNRTVQEQFVDYHEDLLFTDIHAFNKKLAKWCVAYNTVIPHHSLGLLSPVQWLLQNHPECQRYWTSTRPCGQAGHPG